MPSVGFDNRSPSHVSMSRRELLAAGLAGAAGALAGGPALGQEPDAKPALPERKITGRADPKGLRPNVLLIMTDDQGWGDTGYNGHPHLKTPNLDAMAAAGLRFNRFYAAAPVCSPTRGSVMTGRHPNRFGCYYANCLGSGD